MKASTLFWVVILLPWSLVLHAQTTTVQGRVFDSETGLPIPFVNVALTAAGKGTMTNQKGAFKLSTEQRPGRLSISFMGYGTKNLEITRGLSQSVDVALEPRSIELLTAEVRPDKSKKKNPAKPLMQRVIDVKNSNDPSALPAAKHSSYSKLELDLNDISEKQASRWYWGPFKWVFSYLDSSESRVALPFVMAEILAEEQWQVNPKRQQKNIVASQLSSKFSNSKNAAELDAALPKLDIYQNQMLLLDRTFTSPLHDRALAHYRFYILDTLEIQNRPTFHLAFIPRRKGESTFEGELWIDSLTLGLQSIEARLSNASNVNFVRAMHWRQSFEQVPSRDQQGEEAWMMREEHILMDFSLTDRAIGAYLRRTTEFNDLEWQGEKWTKGWTSGRDLQFQPDTLTPDQWITHRPVPLLQREGDIYSMTDSIMAMPQWRFVKGLGYCLGTGYLTRGPLEVGAWWSAFTQNPTEGNRFRLDLRTSNAWSTRFMPKIFAAYGTDDRRWKAGFSARYIQKKTPRTEFLFEIKRDLEQLGMIGLLDQGQAFTSAFRTDSVNSLSEVQRAEVSVLHEFGPGFSGFFEWRHRQIGALGDLEFLEPATAKPVEQLVTSEASLILRFAKKERFVGGEFERVSLGTEWPILTAKMTLGIPNLLGSQYRYTRWTLEGEDEMRLGWWGRLEWYAQAGFYQGTAPFALMEVVPASGTILLSNEAFSMINLYERVTDRWATGLLEWHAEGLVLNHLPLIRKLKLREVVGVRSIIGAWDEKHEDLLELPDNTSGLNGTYSECSFGIENILGIFRVDAVWRTDRPFDQRESWGIRFGFGAEI
jgi:hypothetical protein